MQMINQQDTALEPSVFKNAIQQKHAVSQMLRTEAIDLQTLVETSLQAIRGYVYVQSPQLHI